MLYMYGEYLPWGVAAVCEGHGSYSKLVEHA